MSMLRMRSLSGKISPFPQFETHLTTLKAQWRTRMLIFGGISAREWAYFMAVRQCAFCCVQPLELGELLKLK